MTNSLNNSATYSKGGGYAQELATRAHRHPCQVTLFFHWLAAIAPNSPLYSWQWQNSLLFFRPHFTESWCSLQSHIATKMELLLLQEVEWGGWGDEAASEQEAVSSNVWIDGAQMRTGSNETGSDFRRWQHVSNPTPLFQVSCLGAAWSPQLPHSAPCTSNSILGFWLPPPPSFRCANNCNI